MGGFFPKNRPMILGATTSFRKVSSAILCLGSELELSQILVLKCPWEIKYF